MKRLIEAAPPQTDQFTQRTAREKLAAQLVPAFKADEMHYSGAVAREVSRIVESYNYFAERNRKKCDPETQAMVADAQQLGQLIIQRANDLTASCKQSLDVLKGSARA
jgi:phosphoribosylamine-glycine ligase